MRLAAIAVAIALSIVLSGATRAARADDTESKDDDKGDVRFQKLLIDRVEVRPSIFSGLARVRALVSATELRGERIAITGKDLGLHVPGVKPVPLTGYFATAEVELTLVIIVPTTFDFEPDLETIKTAIDGKLLEPLADLGSRVRVQVVGYDGRGTKGLVSVDGARKALARISGTGDTEPPDLVAILGRAVDTARSGLRKPRNKNALTRAAVVLLSSGELITEDTLDRKEALTKLGEDAAKAQVRIHTLGFVPVLDETRERPRRPLLALGEVSRRSHGTFRWVRDAGMWDALLAQVAEELALQRVVTFYAPPDELAGKKLTVTAPWGGHQLESEPVKLGEPKCGKETCEPDSYCVDGECIQRRLSSGRGAMAWVLLVGGIGVGVIITLLGVVALVSWLRRPRGPAPLPGATAVHAPPYPGAPPAPGMPVAAPPPVAVAPGTPVLIVLTGPAAGARLPLRHGFAIGKAPGCDLDLSHDGFASTHHAQIMFDQSHGGWVLYDQGSTNGTFSNGVRITQARLDHGMTVRLGSTEVRFWQQ